MAGGTLLNGTAITLSKHRASGLEHVCYDETSVKPSKRAGKVEFCWVLLRSQGQNKLCTAMFAGREFQILGPATERRACRELSLSMVCQKTKASREKSLNSAWAEDNKVDWKVELCKQLAKYWVDLLFGNQCNVFRSNDKRSHIIDAPLGRFLEGGYISLLEMDVGYIYIYI